ncbi:MAG TPA: LytTR family DNA-binding domain-containing protein [Hanamia sp.]|nr:LytTR family DNA-binding domain-containing protein [Hanamia sp.]
METENVKKKSRLIVKKDGENIVLPVIDMALLYFDKRTVNVIDRFSKKYFFHKNLSEIEEFLDESVFFRANRQTIVNINFIKGFTALECNKIKVALTLACNEPAIIISQQTVPLFKKWLCES